MTQISLALNHTHKTTGSIPIPYSLRNNNWTNVLPCSPFQVHRIYRSTGASMAKAQAEFMTGAMQNESVRKGMADAAQASARAAFNGNATSGGAGQQQQPAGGRF